MFPSLKEGKCFFLEILGRGRNARLLSPEKIYTCPIYFNIFLPVSNVQKLSLVT